MGKSLETVGLGVTNCCAKLRDALHDTPYPHARGTESIDVATWCGLTPGGQPVDPSDVPDRLLALYLDLLGRLTSIALEAEATLAHAPEGTG